MKGTDQKFYAQSFVPSLARADGKSIDDVRLGLSDAVRRGELFAFVEIPADALTVDPSRATMARIAYVSDAPTYDTLRA